MTDPVGGGVVEWRIRLVGVVGMPDVACELPAGCATVAGRTGLWGKDLRDWVDGEVEVGWWLMVERVREVWRSDPESGRKGAPRAQQEVEDSALGAACYI